MAEYPIRHEDVVRNILLSLPNDGTDEDFAIGLHLTPDAWEVFTGDPGVRRDPGFWIEGSFNPSAPDQLTTAHELARDLFDRAREALRKQETP